MAQNCYVIMAQEWTRHDPTNLTMSWAIKIHNYNIVKQLNEADASTTLLLSLPVGRKRAYLDNNESVIHPMSASSISFKG